jgi:polyhydroxyalkanoate synthesis regulator phasin
MSSKFDFLFPHSQYRGNVGPENLVFNANMQEFAQRVSFIVNLETNGKITPEESYRQIRDLWKQLKQSRKALKVGKRPFDETEDESGPQD